MGIDLVLNIGKAALNTLENNAVYTLKFEVTDKVIGDPTRLNAK
jgi:hypothetical protein